MVASPPIIETIQLTKTYGASRGIRDVNLRVEHGEIFGFLGPNGAGKSTTLRTLLGFLRPTSGHASILGLDCTRESVAVHRRIGNLPSEFSLEDRMTGEEMLRYFARLRGVDQSIPFARELAVRLEADLTRPMRRLSRGNKQKIGIIQALFHRPALVILDEPTSGLDPLMQDVFLEIMRETRDEGRTVFFSSHVLAEVEAIADRVGIIRGGELVAVDSPQSLTSRAFRNVRIRLRSGDLAALGKQITVMPGVGGLELSGDVLRFRFDGDVATLTQTLAEFHLETLDIERPPLEDLFLSYYGQRE